MNDKRNELCETGVTGVPSEGVKEVPNRVYGE